MNAVECQTAYKRLSVLARKKDPIFSSGYCAHRRRRAATRAGGGACGRSILTIEPAISYHTAENPNRHDRLSDGRGVKPLKSICEKLWTVPGPARLRDQPAERREQDRLLSIRPRWEPYAGDMAGRVLRPVRLRSRGRDEGSAGEWGGVGGRGSRELRL